MADSTVFSYGITLSGEGAVRLFPAAKVNFLNHEGEWFTLFLLIDSGANISALPKRGVSANRLYGFGHIIVQSFRRGSVDVRGALVEDAVAVDREASATPTA